MWDEIETAFNDEEPPSKRAKSREWGVVYVGDAPPAPIAITSTTDQAVLQEITLSLGTGLAGAGQQVSKNWGDGNTQNIGLTDGMTAYPHSFLLAAIYNMVLTGALEVITGLHFYGSRLTAFALPNLTNPQLGNLFLYDNMLSNFTLPAAYSGLIHIQLQNNNLNVGSINNILMTVNNWNTSNGILLLNGGTNAAPTGAGLTAKAALIARGWNVVTN